MKVVGKVWVVTGGGSGMGRELALQLLGRGAHVAAVDRDAAAFSGTADAAGALRSRLSTHVVEDHPPHRRPGAPRHLSRTALSTAISNNAGIIQPLTRRSSASST